MAPRARKSVRRLDDGIDARGIGSGTLEAEYDALEASSECAERPQQVRLY